MPSTPIAAFFADSHLQDRAWKDRPIEGDSYYSLQQIVDLAIEYGLQAVVGAGDLIDRQLNRATPIVQLNTQLDRLAAASIPCYYVQGQHEMESRPWLSAHKWPQHINGDMVMIDTFNVFGLDWHPASQLAIALAGIPKDANILAAHQVWSDLMGVGNTEGSFADVASVQTMVTGDYHVYKKVETRGRDGQKLLVISPGSTCMQSIDEPPAKYIAILHEDGKWTRKQLRTRALIAWEDITRPDQVDRAIELLGGEITKAWDMAVDMPENIRKPLLWLKYDRDLGDVQRRLLKVIEGKAHVHWKELVKERPEVTERRAAARVAGQRRGTTMESLLPAYLESKSMTNLQDSAQRLLQAQDVEGELRRLREEALA